MPPVTRILPRRHKVNQEAKHVEEVDQRDGPLQHRSDVVMLPHVLHAEPDGQADLDEDEGELHPEAQAQHAEFAVVDAQPLVLGADEDGVDDVADYEEAYEAVVEVLVVQGVEDGQEDEAGGAGDGGDDGDHGQRFLRG